jgi:hypothetical protein
VKAKPPRPRYNARHFTIPGVDIGDGKRRLVRLRIDREGIEVRVSHSWKLRWWLPFGESVGLLARRAQVREAEKRIRGRCA